MSVPAQQIIVAIVAGQAPSSVTLGVLHAIRIGNSRMNSKIGLKIPRGV
jgi:hypothetical protein